MSVYPEPCRPEQQPADPAAPASQAATPGDLVDTGGGTPTPPGKTKRLLQMGAVGVAGLVAGSALTFAVTANGSTTSDTRDGPRSGQFGGPGGQGGPGYWRNGTGQPPGQGTGSGTGTGTGTDQGQTQPSTQPS
jgi:hypothetical protein